MNRGKQPITKEPKRRRQLGVVIDQGIWRQFRSLAVRKGMSAAAFLEQAMAETIAKEREADHEY